MGVSISWLAVNGMPPEEVRRRLDLSSTGEFGDFVGHSFVGRLLPTAWYLLVARGCDHQLISDAALAMVSTRSAVACSIEEHVMYATATGWQAGAQVWRIEHNSDIDIRHLEITGDPPRPFEEIRASCEANQKLEPTDPRYPVDWYFEIPLELAKQLVGFKHDEVIPGVEDGSFEILRLGVAGPLAVQTKPWWRFW